MSKHKKANWLYNEHRLSNGSFIDKYGNVVYIKNRKFHREDGPAIEFANGYKGWWIDGKEYSTKKEFNKKIKELKLLMKTEIKVEHKKTNWRRKWCNLPDGSYIDSHGDVCYVKDGEFHREDGPARERSNGGKWWYRHGKLHRDGGPAVERADGHKEWWVDGKLHREDGPAVERTSGHAEWWVNGKRHRDGGPAIEYYYGKKVWCINDEYFYSKEDYEEALKVWKLNEVMK